ncbi:CPBP family intramembrane glutamic endopeptidase [Lunatibacter salilacus]|uniref:CPBP family intramembrane glutamic endopeptidase n=1 Tax=Lunatibacter salilacus TaxID=2483804 RepID=UPI00131B1444|nr:CPBP family intramembrane glutamic endopeptidase [Lunatibacter salilacus]
MPKRLFLLGVGTLVVFGGLGIILVELFQEIDFISMLNRGLPFSWQVGAGIVVGGIAAGLALVIITRDFFKDQLAFYQNLIQSFTWTQGSIIFVSFCAGVGEELFFRAGIQPFLGIGWTSVLFVAIHGYLNPSNWRISIYGVCMVGIIAGFGLLFEKWGIVTVMVAHMVFDWVLLTFLTRRSSE